MEKSDAEIIALLKEQNQLLRTLVTTQKQQGWVDMGVRFLPILLLLAALLWIYWSFSSTLNQLTVQVTDIRENMNSVFSLLTDQFTKINSYFSALVTGLKGFLPNLEDFPNLIKDQFLSS